MFFCTQLSHIKCDVSFTSKTQTNTQKQKNKQNIQKNKTQKKTHQNDS